MWALLTLDSLETTFALRALVTLNTLDALLATLALWA
ncbi:hypothetical protein SAMN05444359_1651, partial [Neolewinella agarilytica]